MISVLISRLVLLVFGTLYPAYASYKTVKTKNVKDYVRWMMYWIVFALYTFVEIFSDIFIAFWFPFYYELKILFVFWLICPATRGSTYLFRKLINPYLSEHEKFIDSYIDSLWDHGYDFARKIGARGMDYLIEVVSEFIRKGHIATASFLPKVSDVAQNETVINESGQKAAVQKTAPMQAFDETVLDEEEFDMLMENPEFYDQLHPESSLQADEYVESDSEIEENLSVKKRPLKVVTRSRAKAATVRERKKKVPK